MPRGLQSVVQPFEVDDSKYNFNRMIARHVEFNAVIDGTIDKIGKLNAALGSLPDAKRISIEVSGVDAAIAKVGTLKAALDSIPDTKVVKIVTVGGGDGGGGNFGTFGGGGVSHIRDYNRMLDDYNAAMGEAVAQNRAFNDAQGETARLSRDGRNALSDLRDALGLTRDSATAAQLEIAKGFLADMPLVDQMVSKLGVAKEAYAGIGDASTPLGFTTSHVNALNDALARTRVNADGVTRALSDTEAIKARIMAGSGGYGGAQPGVYYNPLLGGGGGGGGIWPAVAQPGDGGGGAAFLAAAAGARGGRGGGGGLLTAAGYADAITSSVGRVLPAIHYITMAVAELAATVIPAAVALGSAGFVGLQGAQQMATRGTAINTVEQSLGQAYGQTTGSFLGLQPKLQQLQNYAQGGVYEVAGAGINLLKSGVGASFGQQGVQTIAMIDRGIADMQNNMAAKGTGQQLGALMAGGTGYARQFGDIGSNLGNIILGLAPHLPGVGDDWLSALEGITGGASGGIGFLNQHHLGDILGGGMAAEAGWRLGTPLLGLLGKGMGGLGRLAGKIPGLGAAGEEGLTAADLKAMASSDLLGDLGLGDSALLGVGAESGTGLAGLLGGGGAALGALTGPAVAGLAVSAFLGSKLISSMPSGAARKVSSLQAGVDAAGFSAAFQTLGSAITQTKGLAAGLPTTGAGALYGREMGASESPGEFARFGTAGQQTAAQIYQQGAAGFTQQMADLVNNGPSIVKTMSDMGIKGASLGQAFQFAQNSLLDLSHAFNSHGQLTGQAITMMKNYGAALVPMTQNAGALGTAIGAQTIMSQGSVKQLQETNESMDSMTSIMTGGASGMATFFGMLGGPPAGRHPPALSREASRHARWRGPGFTHLLHQRGRVGGLECFHGHFSDPGVHLDGGAEPGPAAYGDDADAGPVQSVRAGAGARTCRVPAGAAAADGEQEPCGAGDGHAAGRADGHRLGPARRRVLRLQPEPGAELQERGEIHRRDRRQHQAGQRRHQ